MKHQALLLQFFFIFCKSYAQQPVIIEYDYLHPANTRVGYLNDHNDTIFQRKKSIRIKGNTPVSFHLINYNPETLKAEAKAKKGVNSDSLSGINFLTFFNTLGSFIAPGIDLTKVLPKRGLLKTEELMRLRPDLEKINAWKYDSDIIALDTTISGKLRQVNNWKIICRELKSLRENTRYTKAETKNKMEELLSTLSPDAPGLLKDENISGLLIRQVARENATYLKKAMEAFSEKIKNRPQSRGNGDINEFDLAEENRKGYLEYINDTTEQDIQRTLTDISNNYQALLKNSFEGRINTFLDGNTEQVTLNFYQKVDVTEKTAVSSQLVHAEPFQINGRGGISITSSIGVSIVKYQKDLENYFVKDQFIAVSKGDKLLPSLSVYLQFSPRSTAAAKLGGHFGLGIPLSDSKSISFLLGPSLLLGAKNTVCINFGILTGKATRLSGGWNVGDKYTGTSPLPTLTRYELGYHAGVSFNISELLRK